MSEEVNTYEKHHSFEDFYSNLKVSLPEQVARSLRLVQAELDSAALASAKREVLSKVIADLREGSDTQGAEPRFALTQFIADELSRIPDQSVGQYLYHRYRYDIFPALKKADNYPPYIQIEPTSVCNFRCVFCYQSDATFSAKKSGAQGSMTLDLFKSIVDEVTGNIEFGSLASRGEPFVSKETKHMLRYAGPKMLGLKLNTNASLLTEENCHAILESNISTVVFSADAADPELYEKLRVNGKFDRVVANIKQFQEIRATQYKNSRTISRVSGVYFDPTHQKLSDMIGFWSELVDQIAFVSYNPWESVYTSPESHVDKACSDLWRRMFVWYDGIVNPCDTDYKSTLQVGKFPEISLSQAWRGAAYEQLRSRHLTGQRKTQEPCRRCVVT